jgi:3alpha(or 20beta)-hydroxysteroid dehydrogenase
VERLSGRLALITGGARGMGAATARRFVEEGAKVLIADVLSEGETLARELGHAARFVELDVADEGGWARAMEIAGSMAPTVDVLVNNAGVASFTPIVDLTVEEFNRVFRVNQLGVFLGMRAVIPAMTSAGRGSIINISSIEGLAGSPLACVYTATKFAVRGMTKVAALELAGSGIRVNSIHPGVVRTPILEVAPGLDLATMIEPSVPLKRVASPEEIASVTVFLASDESSYCTGSEFVVDGGAMAGHVLGVPDNVFATA